MAPQNQDVCVVIHDNVDKTFLDHGDRLSRVESKVEEIDKNFVKTETLVSTLCKKVDLLVTVLIGATGTLCATLMAFLVWYIQTAGR